MNEQNVLWGLLVFVCVLCAWWHIRENRELTHRLAAKTDANFAHWIMHFIWSRTIQMFAVLACTLMILISYDRQLRDMHDNLHLLTKIAEQKEQTKLSVTPAPPTLTLTLPSTTQQTLNPATPSVPPGVSGGAVTLIPPIPQAALDKALDAPKPPANSIDDVYNPEKKGNDAQSDMDAIKKRYEDILVVYMFLKKCDKVKPEDFNTITAALAQEMASVNAPGRLQYDILTAAKGSYKEIYAGSPCNSKDIEALNTQYNDYLKALSSNFPAQ